MGQLVVSCLVILQLNSASGVPTQLCKAHNKQYVGGDLEALVDVTTTADCINACLKVTGANHWQFVRHIWMENNSVDNICHCKDTTGLTATACTSMNCDIEEGVFKLKVLVSSVKQPSVSLGGAGVVVMSVKMIV